MRLEPFYRIEWTDTQSKVPSGFDSVGYERVLQNVVGLQFYPHPQVVLKADYTNAHAKGRNSDGNQRENSIQIGVGYVF